MELSWSTFVLEIINFLVLLWILKRFFYRPIHMAILKRKQNIKEELDKAKKLSNESSQLKEKYENRLQAWENEKEQKMKDFQQEMDEWKACELIKFGKNQEEERQRLLAREMQRITANIEKNTNEAFRLATQFASKFLKAFADNELEEKIIDKTVTDLSNLPTDKMQMLKDYFSAHGTKVVVESAYILNEIKQQQLTNKIEKLMNLKIDFIFIQQPALLAGLNIQMGSVYLHANLRDELKFFTEVRHGSSNK